MFGQSLRGYSVNTELKKALMAAIRSPLEHPSATRRGAIALLAFGAVSTGPAHAQNAPSGSAASKSNVLEEIVITGSRRVGRSATDSASPVDIISGSDINAQPSANMLDSVRNIVPSFFVGQNTISDASTFVR